LSTLLPVKEVISVCTLRGESDESRFLAVGIIVEVQMSRMSSDLQNDVALLEDAMGIRDSYLWKAWKIRGSGRFGYVVLEQEGRKSYFSFYLRIRGVWNRLVFQREEVDGNLYQTTGFGNVVEVAMEEETYRPRLQLLVADEGEDRFWLIYCLTSGIQVLLSTVCTSVAPYIVVVL
jgi:hypothetical protein